MNINIQGGNLPVAEVQELVELLAKTYNYKASYDANTGSISLIPEKKDDLTIDLFAQIDFSKAH